VAVEDPGYTAVLDLVGALGLQAEPVALDAYGPLPRSLEAALSRGAAAFVLTPRAQNPTGAALSAERARALAAVFARHPEALVVEDDHAGPVAGAPAATTAPPGHPRWAVVRSVSKWLGPDLRVAFLAGDEATVSRVEGRQALGSGWVSHLLQGTVARLWQSSETGKRLQQAATLYARRREDLIEALRRRRIEAAGRSGLNVWIPVPEEASVVSALAGRGFAVRAGEPYRIASAPAIRVTTAALDPRDAERFAAALAEVLKPRVRGAFV
jgi:DNA-binding transcriptional MocR family regulator